MRQRLMTLLVLACALHVSAQTPLPQDPEVRTGKLKNAEKTTLTIHSYLPDGTVDPNVTEQIQFLVFQADACEPIADYSKLHYYVTK